MHYLLAICLGLLCLARATPVTDDDSKPQIPEEDKRLILKLAEVGSTMMVVLMTEPTKIMMDVINSIMESKKADQHVLDFIQNRLNKANRTNTDDDSSEEDTPVPEYFKDLSNMFSIYAKPKNVEKRILFNLWTNGQFDILMGKYFQTVLDQQNTFIETVRTTVSQLSETSKNSHKKLIENFNNSVEKNDVMDAATRLFNVLTYRAEVFRSAPNFNLLQTFDEKVNPIENQNENIKSFLNM